MHYLLIEAIYSILTFYENNLFEFYSVYEFILIIYHYLFIYRLKFFKTILLKYN
jgi:hypothetical protein